MLSEKTQKLPAGTIIQHLLKKAQYSKLSFEDLPEEYIEFILQLLDTDGVLKVCTLSSYLNDLAQNRLYKKIGILAFPEESTNSNVWSRATYDGVAYTSVLEHKLPMLVNSILKNPILKDLIETVFINHLVESKSITLLLSLLQLKQLHWASSEKIAPHNTQSLEKLTCHVSDLESLMRRVADGFPDTAKDIGDTLFSFKGVPRTWHFRNLVDLEIVFDQHQGDAQCFDSLAYQLLGVDVHSKLKSLAFKSRYPPGQRYGVRAPWYSFFREMAEEGYTMELETLKLDAVLSDFPFKDICEVIEFYKLKSLEVNFQREYGKKSYQSKKNSFLPSLLKQAYSLQHFSVFFYWNDDMIMRVLENCLSQSLKSLFVVYQSDSPPSSDLARAILSRQRNLERLRIETHPESDQHCASRHKNNPPFLVENNYKHITDRAAMFSFSPLITEFDRPATFRLPDACEKIKSHKGDIVKLLASDLIYQNASKQMPSLKQYFVSGLEINMKKNAVVVNGEMIPLE